MRFAAIFALAGAASASAHLFGRQTIPQCGLDCIAKADFGSCLSSDTACLCKFQPFVDSTTQCIATTCQGQDLQNAITAAQELCAAVGVTLTSTPSGVTIPPSTASPTAGGSSASGASTTPTSPAAAGTSKSSSGTSAPAATSPAPSSGASKLGAASTFGALIAVGLAALSL
ncbi:hypothetical protein BD410DRAFT_781822 [Rickenella mellea]|uniref:CFEM domain-containing protein n=1 Tax=Rickenella mellea TaxID=50990 RepID=A0A4Y7QJQ2_9AGAM|nr:hypothetical protein BD410DRAFT_781822 [Rickenella mellea]